MAEGNCVDCGSGPAQTWISGEGPLCDGCADARIAAATGFPRLPPAPGPMVVAGPDGREHTLRVRLTRAPGGVVAEAIEVLPSGADGDPDNGFQIRVFGEHDADVTALLAELDERVRAEVGRRYLEHDAGGWQVAGFEVAGRVSWSEAGPPDVVVDGRRLSWDEFGHAVASFEGWWFRLAFGDDTPPPPALGPGAVVVPLRRRE